MPNSRVRISTHTPEEPAQTSFVGRGETVWELTQQCPNCAERRVATNGVMKWCMVCGWEASVKHPRRHVERDEY